jgi:hypothetical protein
LEETALETETTNAQHAEGELGAVETKTVGREGAGKGEDGERAREEDGEIEDGKVHGSI